MSRTGIVRLGVMPSLPVMDSELGLQLVFYYLLSPLSDCYYRIHELNITAMAMSYIISSLYKPSLAPYPFITYFNTKIY